MPAEERKPSAHHAEGGRLAVADPLFVPLTTRGADPRCEPYRYGWSSGTPHRFPARFYLPEALSATLSTAESGTPITVPGPKAVCR